MMMLDQKKENMFTYTTPPETLSFVLSGYWQEEINAPQIRKKCVQILKDIHLPASSKQKTQALYIRIEKKLSDLCKMMKKYVKRNDSADLMDREIYLFTRIIEQTIKRNYFWTADMTCTALTLFLQDTTYTLRVSAASYRQEAMKQYAESYVLLWKDYLKDYIMLEWWTANEVETTRRLYFSRAAYDKIADREANKIFCSPSADATFNSVINKNEHNDPLTNADEAHYYLYLSYLGILAKNNEQMELACQCSIDVVHHTETILQKRSRELIDMSKQYREYLKIPGLPQNPFSAFSPYAETEEPTSKQSISAIQEEMSHMNMADLLKSVLGEEILNRINHQN